MAESGILPLVIPRGFTTWGTRVRMVRVVMVVRGVGKVRVRKNRVGILEEGMSGASQVEDKNGPLCRSACRQWH